MKKCAFILWVAVLALTGCGASNDGDTGTRAKLISGNDAEINAAKDHARETVDEFLIHLLNPAATERAFSVKKRVEGNGAVEYFWLDDLRYEDGVFTGRIGNEPEHVHTVAYKEEVSVPASEISDWMYMDGDKMVGNFTFRVIVDRMPSDEAAAVRAQFQL